MELTFYISGGLAVLATLMTITRAYAVHALLYAVVSLLATAVAFFVLGAPFAAALEAIVYAGAIMVLFVFAIMMLDLSRPVPGRERRLLRPSTWALPAAMVMVLLVEVVYILATGRAGGEIVNIQQIEPKEVAISLFGPYVLGVELASFLLLSALVGALHLGRGPLAEDAQ